MYIEEEMTDRIKKIREIYKACPVATQKRPHYYSGDRWLSLGFLEGWLENEATFTTKIRRSKAEARELDEAKPIINEHELICGELYFPDYTPEEQKRFDELVEAFHMSPTGHKTESHRSRTDHICMDFEKLLRVGINGLIREIEQKKAELDFGETSNLYDFQVAEKREFYDCCLMELEAVVRLAQRYADYAQELAGKAEEPRKSELLQMAKNMRQVPANPATSFYEAVQSVHFYIYNMFGLYPMGRPDRYLLPYYEEDLKNGKITKAFAQELIDNLCLKVSTYVFARAACGFIVGGSDKDGNLVENDLTYMFLTALRHIRMPDPNGALAVNRQTSAECLRYAVDILGDGTTHPAIYNDEVIIKGLMEYGIPREDACHYIHTTCAEISICGKSRMYTTSHNINMPRALLRVVEEDQPDTYEELEDLFFRLLKNNVENYNKNYLLRILEASRNGYQSMRASCLVDNCIERGKDVYSGGAAYSYMQPTFIGFANVCDSLYAIRQLVFEEKKLTLQEFFEIVKSDYEDHEPLRLYIRNKLPHYGNDDDRIDSFAHGLMSRLGKVFKDNEVFGGSFSIPGTFSYMTHAKMGKSTIATFDGRKAYTSLSDGCGPVQGLDRNGPTAMINSVTGWDQQRFLGGMVINVKFTKSMFDDAKKALFLDVIDAFIQRGGVEMQVNCVDRKTLEDAVIHPEEHGDLIVRIGGYSDYFVKQMPCVQQEIIERTQY